MWKLPDGRDWLWGKLGLALVGKAMLSKSLIQFSADEWGCVLSYFGLRPNSGRGNDPAPQGLMPARHDSPGRLQSGSLTPQQATTDPRLRWRLL